MEAKNIPQMSFDNAAERRYVSSYSLPRAGYT